MHDWGQVLLDLLIYAFGYIVGHLLGYRSGFRSSNSDKEELKRYLQGRFRDR